MKSRFNLATSPLENNRRFIAGAGALGLLALVALVLLSVHTYTTWRADRAIREDMDRLTVQIRADQQAQDALRKEFSTKAAMDTMARSTYLNGLIAQRVFPWTKMFADLEHVLPPGVHVISISPHRDKEGNVSLDLSVGAQDDSSILKFLQSLESSPAFSNIQVSSEPRPTQNSGPGASDKVLLALQMRYAI
ncbi:MAG TPA: PilN domain-containing protein [Candidatus Acidoferrales bacterium]|nr:PilN domain-containing protein [Candidatus Acidoferrales bacterium]